MINTHVIIPLSKFDELSKDIESITGNEIGDLMQKAFLTGQ